MDNFWRWNVILNLLEVIAVSHSHLTNTIFIRQVYTKDGISSFLFVLFFVFDSSLSEDYLMCTVIVSLRQQSKTFLLLYNVNIVRALPMFAMLSRRTRGSVVEDDLTCAFPAKPYAIASGT